SRRRGRGREVTPERLLESLREHMPAAVVGGGLFTTEPGLAWLLGGKSRRQMRELREAGALPPGAKIGGRWLFDLVDVAAWLDAQKVDEERREAAESGGSGIRSEERRGG